MVQRMLGPDPISANKLGEETGVCQSTLSRWSREAPDEVKKRANGVPKSSDSNESRPVRPDDLPPAEKFRLLREAGELSDEDLGAFLRRKGSHRDQNERRKTPQLSVTTSCTFLRETSSSYLRATTSGTANSLSASDLPHRPSSGRSDHGHHPHASHLRPSVPAADQRSRRRPTRNPGRYLRGGSPSDSTPRTPSPRSSKPRAVWRLETVRPPSYSPTLESRTSTRKSMSSSIPAPLGASLR